MAFSISHLNLTPLSLNPKFPISTLPPPHLHRLHHSRRRNATSLLRCSASSFSTNHHANFPNSYDVTELPLFPLPLVLFPGAILPLQIFEFRYRLMMHTLLETDLRFGVIYTDAVSGTAEVGCVGEVIKHERRVHDRFFILCKGQERFRVTKIVREKPYLVARVAFLEDRPSSSPSHVNVNDLANEVETYMKDVIRLSNRLAGKKAEKDEKSKKEEKAEKEEKTEKEENAEKDEKAEKEEKAEKDGGELRRNMFPTLFSFFVGSTFEGAPREQQALLELEDTTARLLREKETLKNTLKYLSAAAAIKDIFS